ncbi:MULTISPECIES: response regulator transcription factor [unclassified Devosia]|uniref:response regulator n=1 Tax=unclassified Devosia TaxID=196773 RepID=UPI0009623BF2|nr:MULTISPECIES: response regulator transcription factor [unclassified Devosia]MBN9364879.1 response regulator transcription factor [Devosia sp.]OJX25722.1 MAG: DNA-binding response regulator [Devosia sp. 66-14]
MRILLIEDDYVLGEAIRDHVRADGHGVDWMQRLDDARAALDTVEYGLILLDLSLPDGRGLDLLKQLRRAGNPVPVIVTTAQDQVAIRIEGLNAGADDYLVKPFDLDELSARVSAVARRYAGLAQPQLRLGEASVNLATRTITLGDKPIGVTAREWAVLERLLSRRGGIVTKAEIEDSLYPFGAEIEGNAVEVYVSRLRKKLGQSVITTVRGMGYRIEP